jgi:hypothetical protein
MPVGVVGAQRHESQPGAGGEHELPVRVVAAVVGHLEHVRLQVGAAAAEAGLGVCAQVAGEQDRQPASLGADDHRQVVRGRGCRRQGRLRSEHLQSHRADPSDVTGHQGQPLGSGPVDEDGEAGHPVVGGRQGARGHCADVAAGQRPGQTTHVVGVEMRDEDQGQGRDAQPVQAPVDSSHVGSGVDEDPGSVPGREHDRVALAHVADHGQGVRRRPAPHRLPQRLADDDQTDHGRQREQP